MTTERTLPSIRNRALLIGLTFNKPALTKLDRKATRDAEVANNARGVLRTQKMLYPKHLIDPILALEAEARAYLRSHSVEWGPSGLYLIDTSLFMDVRAKLDEYEIRRQQEVTRFAQNFANVLMEAERSQGTLFDEAEYPDVHDVVRQFQMHVFVAPLGDLAPTLFTDIEEEIREQIAEDVEASTKAAVEAAVAQPLERLLEAVLNVYDKTSRDGTRIHDSMMERLTQIVDRMKSLNVMEVPELDALANACRKRLVKPTDMLRGKENATRTEVAGAAKAILEAAGVGTDALRDVSSEQSRRDVAEQATQDILKRMKLFA